MIISSTSGHACEDTQHKYPYIHDGHLLRLKFSQNVYELLTQTDGHGTLQATKTSGLPGDSVTLNPIPNDKYTFSGYQSTGCTINGNTLTFGSQDCTAKATFYKEPEEILVGPITGGFNMYNRNGAVVGSASGTSNYLEPIVNVGNNEFVRITDIAVWYVPSSTASVHYFNVYSGESLPTIASFSTRYERYSNYGMSVRPEQELSGTGTRWKFDCVDARTDNRYINGTPYFASWSGNLYRIE
ncbi:MAG: hypothetical protein MJZ37_06950 [Bacilli bacterium]|nr:hypothetical protein [Bacilli bacterium]